MVERGILEARFLTRRRYAKQLLIMVVRGILEARFLTRPLSAKQLFMMVVRGILKLGLLLDHALLNNYL